MKYKFIKNNSKKIFPIGLGCGIGNYNSHYSYKELLTIIRKSFEYGVNFFDTAPVYGDGASEKILGNAFSLREKEKIFIATKISPEMLASSNIVKSVNNSRKNLKVNNIDLIQIHWPNPKINLFESMDTLLKLRDDKIVKSIGICNYTFSDLKKILKKYGSSSISTFQTEYNLFDRTADGELYNFLKKNNIILLGYSPLAQGKIFNGKNQKTILEIISKKYNISIAQLILNWMSKKNIIPIPNSLNNKRMLENIKSINFSILSKDLKIIESKCKSKIEKIDAKKIVIESKLNPKVYTTIEEAKLNKFNMVPSPLNLSREIKENPKMIKPIRIKEVFFKKRKKLYLIEGRLRFWSWIIAFGWNKKIPALVWYSKKK